MPDWQECEKLIELRAIPCLPSGAALGFASFPVVHVEPLDMAHGHRRPDLAFRFDQDGGDSAALGMQRDRQLVEADARVARGIARQESQGPVRRLQSVDDATAPIVARFDLGSINPDVVTVLLQIHADTLDQTRIPVVPIAQKNSHARRPSSDRRNPVQRGPV